MKTFAFVAILAALAGCTAIDRVTTARDPDAVREREMTRRYAFCVKTSLGRFGSFASPESRRKAAESCQSVMQETAAN